MFKKLHIIILITGGALLSSCDNLLDIQPVGKVIPTTVADYRALLTTAYSTPLIDRGVCDMRTDEVVISKDEYDQSRFTDIEKWNDGRNSVSAYTFGWKDYYNVAFYANAVIDKGYEMTEGSQHDIDQLLGEAYLLRGYMHFLLVNLYGQPYSKAGAPDTKAIPLKRNIDLEEIPSRNTVKEIYTSVLEDIEKARTLIHQTTWETKYSYRFSTLSVDAMESRVRLYMAEWKSAYDAAERVLAVKAALEDLNSSESKLPNNFQSVEIITAYEFIYSTAINKASFVTPTFLQKFQPNIDLRPNRYFVKSTKEDGFLSIKGGSSEFRCSFRIGELYLNSAEAAAHLNMLPEARTRLLQLMEKRYTPEGYVQKKALVNSMNQANLIAEILEERARELSFEGHRWFDLRRTNRPQITKVLNGTTYILEQDDPRYTLRIPQEAIEANPGLLN